MRYKGMSEASSSFGGLARVCPWPEKNEPVASKRSGTIIRRSRKNFDLALSGWSSVAGKTELPGCGCPSTVVLYCITHLNFILQAQLDRFMRRIMRHF